MKITSLMTKKRNSLFRIFLCHLLFFIPRTAWTKLQKTQKKDHLKGMQWTNSIPAGIHTIQPHFCILGYRVKCMVQHVIHLFLNALLNVCSVMYGKIELQKQPVRVEQTIKERYTSNFKTLFQGHSILKAWKNLRNQWLSQAVEMTPHHQEFLNPFPVDKE